MTLAPWIVLGFSFVAPVQSAWQLPATIKVTQDVEVRRLSRADVLSGEMRGRLYIGGGQPTATAFQMKKGQTFQMVKIYTEGTCRIRFEKNQYDLTSCPWLEGFADNQADIFNVITGRGRWARGGMDSEIC
jgi:hypothetical protein